MEVHQLVHTLNYGDAISGEAILLQRIFRARYGKSEIFSLHAHDLVKQFRQDWRNFPKLVASQDSGAVRVILHYSLASPLNELYFALGSNVEKILIYHNLTPERWYRRYNARVLKDLRQGRNELAKLVEFSDSCWADSSFNAGELEKLGAGSVEVLSLAFDSERWSRAANAGIERVLRGHGGKNFLHVGRLAPNKCIEDIIKAFYFYHHKINRQSRLWLVGSDVDNELYSFELRRLVSRLQLKEAVAFVGSVSDEELRAFYESADIYLCMSEHEGFCVPLVEAMHFGVPIVAFDAAAVGDTLGEAGVLLANKEPSLVAELFNLIETDTNFRQELISKGYEQEKRFSLERFESRLDELESRSPSKKYLKATCSV